MFGGFYFGSVYFGEEEVFNETFISTSLKLTGFVYNPAIRRVFGQNIITPISTNIDNIVTGITRSNPIDIASG